MQTRKIIFLWVGGSLDETAYQNIVKILASKQYLHVLLAFVRNSASRVILSLQISRRLSWTSRANIQKYWLNAFSISSDWIAVEIGALCCRVQFESVKLSHTLVHNVSLLGYMTSSPCSGSSGKLTSNAAYLLVLMINQSTITSETVADV